MMHKASPSLQELENKGAFQHRHIGLGEAEIEAMLKDVGVTSLDDLIEKTVPSAIRTKRPLHDLPPLRESEALAELAGMAAENRVMTSMIGMGYYDCHLPAVIQRNVLENPGWYTAYTPYQAEVSQGRLEALLNFQQMVIDLTGLPLANASLLDEATAAAEAMTLARRVSKAQSACFFVDAACHPQTIAVVETRARPLGIEIVRGDPARDLASGEFFGVLLQYPASDGEIRDPRPAIKAAHEMGALVAVAADLLSLVLLTPPGEMGADIVLGSAQRFGVPMGFGGPHAAFFATKDEHKRALPGRIIGVSVDRDGRPALRMALQTREQHIRREKATSNICTAQVLLAVIAGFYAVYHGPEGLKRIARRVHRLTGILAAGLAELGREVVHSAYFDALKVRVSGEAQTLLDEATKDGINLRRIDEDHLGIALDETTTREEIETLWRVFGNGASRAPSIESLDPRMESSIPESLRRKSEFLTHTVFGSYRSETEMLRYLKRLEDKDIALNRAMIPLGSCTMKLNATSEMVPITWPGFSRMHPFAPADQTRGYRRLFASLEEMLCRITGFAAVSLQPNAGSQGEYSGLLVIHRYHESRGEGHRRVCLIPSSAHGTNPASAVLAGLEVVVVACDKAGNIDLADLREKAEENKDRLAALMVTYPSTHGVFEEAIVEICEIVHANGGQVYMDGANLNALVGIARPGSFGPDVMHMNLHKTFCIPHGGGGPGMGPIGVAKHLAPFLPRHPVVADSGPETGIGAVSAAPWGSASILPISWAYIAMMGGQGLTRATVAAILSANYIAKRLSKHYPVLYTGRNGLVAHECIIDLRPLKETSGIEAEDVAKRLVDYGFHAPTMSFPVPGTLMIEPTESEPKAELDRFVEAMVSIRREIAKVEKGEWPADDNPLINAPHTAESLIAEDWPHGYSRSVAAYPVDGLRLEKFWPPVSRVDNVYGDRHLVCSCPPLEAYQRAAE